jgi:hypothetical protein
VTSVIPCQIIKYVVAGEFLSVMIMCIIFYKILVLHTSVFAGGV